MHIFFLFLGGPVWVHHAGWSQEDGAGDEELPHTENAGAPGNHHGSHGSPVTQQRIFSFADYDRFYHVIVRTYSTFTSSDSCSYLYIVCVCLLFITYVNVYILEPQYIIPVQQLYAYRITVQISFPTACIQVFLSQLHVHVLRKCQKCFAPNFLKDFTLLWLYPRKHGRYLFLHKYNMFVI